VPEYNEIGPWSEIKLEILRDYAAPYSKIVSANGFYHHYIDGFAGAGSHISRKTGEPVAGSPLNALKTDPPFREYHSSISILLESSNCEDRPRTRLTCMSMLATAMKYFCAACCR
jgi:three-Cys-motif partner protein